MSRLIFSLLALLIIAAPAGVAARTIDNTGLAGSEIVDGMWNDICSALPFCDVGEDAVDMIARQVINVVFDIITSLAVIVMMYGGIKMIASRGNEEGYAQAKKVAFYAGVGLIIALLAENLVLYIADDLLPTMLGG